MKNSIAYEELQPKFLEHSKPKVLLYWQLGHIIEQYLQENMESIDAVARSLSKQLYTQKTHNHYTTRLLKKIHQFYLTFTDESQIYPQLSWSHYCLLMRIKDKDIRHFYLEAAATAHWTLKHLQKQYKNKLHNNANCYENSTPLFKQSYSFDFLTKIDTERALETQIIAHLPSFLIELGHGFTFVAQQKRICTKNGRSYIIDLVCYHHVAKCFVLIELKNKKLKPQDLGQLYHYVQLWNQLHLSKGHAPTKGLLLCKEYDPILAQLYNEKIQIANIVSIANKNPTP